MMRAIPCRHLVRIGSVLIYVTAVAGAGSATAQGSLNGPGNPTVLDVVHDVQTQLADLNALVQKLTQKIDDLQSQAGSIPPAWAQALGADRFVVTMGGEAVLDRETGLVWEQSPGKIPGSPKIFKESFDRAVDCVDRTTGGRRGWRLPSVWELSTLIDPVNRNPALPSGHPFENVSSDIRFWTTTPFSVGFDAGTAWVVSFDGDFPGAGTTGPDQFFRLWCVRGPGGVPPVAPTIK